MSNLTLASGLVLRRGKSNSASKRGYCGDVVTGPFVCYGFEYSTEVHMTRTKSERMAQDRAFKYLSKVVRRVWDGRKGEVEAQFPKVTFLSVSSAERDLMRKAKFTKTFHSAFVACSVTHFLQVSDNLTPGLTN